MKTRPTGRRRKERHASSASPQEPGSAGERLGVPLLNLDPGRTRTWFDQRFTHKGYATEVTKALGAYVLDEILTTSASRGGSKMHHKTADAPQAAGRVLHGARWYDLFGRVISFGRDKAIREKLIELAAPAPKVV